MSILGCDSQPKNPCDNMHVSVTGSVRNWMSSLSNNTLTGSFYVHTGWVYMHVYKGAESDASCCVFFISSTHIKQCVQNIFYSNVICKSLSPSLPPSLPPSHRPSVSSVCCADSLPLHEAILPLPYHFRKADLYQEGDGEGQRTLKRQGSLKAPLFQVGIYYPHYRALFPMSTLHSIYTLNVYALCIDLHIHILHCNRVENCFVNTIESSISGKIKISLFPKVWLIAMLFIIMLKLP